MKLNIFTAVALGTMAITAGSALASASLNNERDHDGSRWTSGAVSGVLPYTSIDPRIDATGYVMAPTVKGKTGGFSLQNERDHDGSFKN